MSSMRIGLKVRVFQFTIAFLALAAAGATSLRAQTGLERLEVVLWPEYDRPAGRIVCTGKPWVVEGANRIRGDVIEYLLKKDEVRVTEPRAIFEMPDENQKKAGLEE